MRKTHHVHALFDSADAAAAAYATIQARGCSSERCSAFLHEKHVEEANLTTDERAGREGARTGAMVAGAAGAVIGGLAALGGGILGVGPLVGAAFGGGVMAAYGALLGGISGSDEPEMHLRALAKEVEEGKILVAVETDDEELQSMCRMVFEENGGRPIAF
jgi:uncharacterized membrane protein